MEAMNREGGPTRPAPKEEQPGAEGVPAGDGVPVDAGVASGEAAAVEGDLDALLSQAERERDEYLELARRSRADFENFRKRASEDARAAERRGRASLLEGLLPSLDNLERALLASGIDPKGPAPEQPADPPSQEVSAHEALAQGVGLVYREMSSKLEAAGVESYDPTGERFDPTLHEAVATRPDAGEAGIVVETLHKGYRLDGQVLRPAAVLVSE